MTKVSNKIQSAEMIKEAMVPNLEYHIHHCTSGYVYEGGQLVHAKVSRVVIDLKNGHFTTTLTTNEKESFTKEDEFNMYRSPEDFYKNIPREATSVSSYNLISHSHPNDGRYSPNKIVEDGKEFICLPVWVLEDGEPIKFPLSIHTITWDCNGEHGWIFSDKNLPEKYWFSRTEAISNNEYKIVDEDGEAFVERGVNLRLALTDEQKKILEELEAVFKKAKDAGIGFLFDRECCGNLEVYNANEVTEIEYCSKPEFHKGDLVDIDCKSLHASSISVYDYCGSDSYQFVMKPTPRQLKEWKRNHPDD